MVDWLLAKGREVIAIEDPHRVLERGSGGYRDIDRWILGGARSLKRKRGGSRGRDRWNLGGAGIWKREMGGNGVGCCSGWILGGARVFSHRFNFCLVVAFSLHMSKKVQGSTTNYTIL